MTLSNEVIARVLPDRDALWLPDTTAEAQKFASFENTDRYGDHDELRQVSYAWQKALTKLIRDKRDWAADSLTARSSKDENLGFAVGFVEFDASLRSAELTSDVTKGTRYFFGAVVFDKLHPTREALRLELNAGQIDDRFAHIPIVLTP